jgi:hypothetical protein
MKRLLTICMILLLAFGSLSATIGCQAMGHGAGETAEEVEEGANEFEEGYEEGKESD